MRTTPQWDHLVVLSGKSHVVRCPKYRRNVLVRRPPVGSGYR